MSRELVRALNRKVGQREAQAQAQRDALIELLLRSLKLGHRRLAMRRFFMLQVRGHEVPADLLSECRTLIALASATEVRSIHDSVRAWSRMLDGSEALERSVPCPQNINNLTAS